jgi:CheY-like chemotaxis protein
VALAACLQLDFCTPNASIQEQSPGAAFVIALNSAEALEKIEAAKAENMKFGNAKTDNAPYDLIFMDYMMPDTDGTEVTAEIRK